MSRRGGSGPGAARRGVSGHGKARIVHMRQGGEAEYLQRGSSGLGKTRLGEARQVAARQGEGIDYERRVDKKAGRGD